MREAQDAGIKFTEAENEVFRPAGATHCTDSCETWHGRRARGSAWLCKISPQSAQGVGMRPPNMKNFHFSKESPRRAEPFDRFLEFLWAFIRPNILH